MKNNLLQKLLLIVFVSLFSYKVSAVTDLKLSDDHCEGREPAVVYFATHAIAHPFWTVVENGAMEGARDACLTLKWTEDVDFSVQTTIERMEIAVTEKPDVLVITATDPAAMRDTVERAVANGVPVIAINVYDPAPPTERLPYMIYVGGDEYKGGEAAAYRLLKEFDGKPNRALCSNGYPGHVGLELRCKGFADVMEAQGIPYTLLDTGGGQANAEGALSAYFLKHPDTDIYFANACCPQGWETAKMVLEQQGLIGQVKAATYDLPPIVMESISDGSLIAGIDQSPYSQGYLAAILARQYIDWGLMPYEQILTGPAIVDSSNIEKVKAGAAVKRR